VDLAALVARAAMPRPAPCALPTLAELAREATGTDWPEIAAEQIGLWAAGHFDLGQAFWAPAPGQGAWAAWRAWATHDLAPGLAGLAGFAHHAAQAPDTAPRAILRAALALGLTPAAGETAFHRLLIDLGGWAQHARWRAWEAGQKGASDTSLTDLLAIRLMWEEALLARHPDLAGAWGEVVAAHARPVAPSAEDVADAILQDAAERAHQRALGARLGAPPAPAGRPVLQAAFCIDVRSEVFRRALEGQGPGIATLGFAGFFGLPLAHRPLGATEAEAHLPVLLTPALTTAPAAPPAADEAARIAARASRAWGRFGRAAVSSFAFVEAAGPLAGWKIVRDALGLAPAAAPAEPAPALMPPADPGQQAATAAAVLRAMGLASGGQARLVLLLGHGANVTNNPHESAYHCGACGGQTGTVSARMLAGLLNDPVTRAGLPGQGIALPADTWFVAGLHDTTTDAVTLHAEGLPAGHAPDLAAARTALARAGEVARAERAGRLPGAARAADIAARARNWAEVRPEWGLAGCAAFIAAPRGVTAGADLGGRAFLHSYDWREDAGFGVLELILTAPVVVASWISLQYYGSTLMPGVFGGGNKLVHNVVGGLGVVEGNGGRLRAGLPWQAVHDGARPAHEALRLSVLVEAPEAAVTDILARHAGVRALFDNGWLHLILLQDGRPARRYRPGLAWEGAA
jgi:uncharacterized protein YbcC (UPF0753/DUF2309 family)